MAFVERVLGCQNFWKYEKVGERCCTPSKTAMVMSSKIPKYQIPEERTGEAEQLVKWCLWEMGTTWRGFGMVGTDLPLRRFPALSFMDQCTNNFHAYFTSLLRIRGYEVFRMQHKATAFMGCGFLMRIFIFTIFVLWFLSHKIIYLYLILLLCYFW